MANLVGVVSGTKIFARGYVLLPPFSKILATPLRTYMFKPASDCVVVHVHFVYIYTSYRTVWLIKKLQPTGVARIFGMGMLKSYNACNESIMPKVMSTN